jgi:nucleoside-diphosphate-sugar epimerase
MSKPRVIVLGGNGFIGKYLVQYLVEKDLCSKIRVADKVLPSFAGLTKIQDEYYKTKTDLLEFKQTPLTQEAKIETLFDESEGKWDYVFNLAGETKYSQTEAVYKENIIDLSVKCGKVAARHGVKKFIEVSTAQIYDAGKKPSDEHSKTEPWTNLAKAKLQAEEELKKIQGLNLVIVRPAIVYGPGDMNG